MPRLYLRMPPSSLTGLMSSFAGFMDIKVGCQILSLFSLFNKIAGVYGIIAVFQGGSLAQVSLYVYSIATIPIFIWGLKAISDEKHEAALRYAHVYMLDHMVSTGWTMLFALWWYCYAPHDGRRVSNSDHQAGLMSLVESLEAQYHTPEEMAQLRHKDIDLNTPEGAAEAALRAQQANETWRSERGFAAGVLVMGWLLKVRAWNLHRSTLPSCYMRMRCICDMARIGCCRFRNRGGPMQCMPLHTTSCPMRAMRSHCPKMAPGRYLHSYMLSPISDGLHVSRRQPLALGCGSWTDPSRALHPACSSSRPPSADSVICGIIVLHATG